jgi:hypothetical protein
LPGADLGAGSEPLDSRRQTLNVVADAVDAI